MALSAENGWTPELEALAIKALAQAAGYSWMLQRTAGRALRWSQGISIASGLLGGVVGTRGLVGLALDDSVLPWWAGLLDAAAGFAISALLLFERTWSLHSRHVCALSAQVDYARVAREIQLQLALPPAERKSASAFIEHVLAEIETIKLSTPAPDHVDRQQYASRFVTNPFRPETADAGSRAVAAPSRTSSTLVDGCEPLDLERGGPQVLGRSSSPM